MGNTPINTPDVVNQEDFFGGDLSETNGSNPKVTALSKHGLLYTWLVVWNSIYFSIYWE
jgi:hypothetical protein